MRKLTKLIKTIVTNGRCDAHELYKEGLSKPSVYYKWGKILLIVDRYSDGGYMYYLKLGSTSHEFFSWVTLHC